MPNRPQIVAEELRKKIRLEDIFRKDVNSLFNRMVREYRTSIAGLGTAPQSDIFTEDWLALYKKHYIRVQEAFTGDVLNQQKKCNPTWYEKKQEQEEDDTLEKEALFLLALQSWRDKTSRDASEFVTATNQKDFNKALQKAREIIREQGLPTDNRTLATTASAILDREFKGRVDGVVMFETQRAAESTKLIEASVLSETDPFPRGGFGVADTLATKTWWTVGDDKVREAHVAANGQKKKLMSPLLSMGNYLCILVTQLLGHRLVIWPIVGVRLSMTYRGV